MDGLDAAALALGNDDRKAGLDVIAADLRLPADVVSRWQIVPVDRVIRLEGMTGISRHRLRVDFDQVFLGGQGVPPGLEQDPKFRSGNAVLNAIDDHRRAFEAEEALYDNAGKPLVCEAEAKAAAIRVRECFRTIVKMPCTNGDDVQYKLKFLLDEKTSCSEPALTAILSDDYADEEFQGTCGYELHDEFLQTLRLWR
jgi:hypothetical protein